MESLDKLKIESDSDYVKQLEEDEIVMFSEKAGKINRYGYKQSRIIILTTSNLYTFKKK